MKARTTEQRRAYARAYYALNRERLLAQAKQRREADPQKVRASVRTAVAAHYASNREVVLAAKRERYANDPAMRERMKENSRRRRLEKRAVA